jgi:hypothetical protein
MAMDENTRWLADLLKDTGLQFPDPMIDALLRDAREEAFAEAKAILKERMVRAILGCSLEKLREGNGKEQTLQEIETAQDAELAEIDEKNSKEQTLQEIETLKRQIAENDRLLSEMKEAARGSPESGSPDPTLPAEKEVTSPQQREEQAFGYYVYGIMWSGDAQPVNGLPDEGIDPAYPVYVLPYRAIQAVVSKVSLSEFSQERIKANLNDVKWVEARVRTHEAVLEAAMSGRSLIPMRFCTIYQSESRVQEVLVEHYEDFITNLTRLVSKQEWAVKVFCDNENLARKAEEVSDKVKELKEEMAGKSSGAMYFLKKKVEQAIAEEAERMSDEVTQASHDRLAGHAEDARVTPLQSKQLTGRTEEMILNGAYLVSEGQITVFRAELESLEKDYDDLGFSYELSGPWPPYNFVTISFETSTECPEAPGND